MVLGQIEGEGLDPVRRLAAEVGDLPLPLNRLAAEAGGLLPEQAEPPALFLIDLESSRRGSLIVALGDGEEDSLAPVVL
jgi:hypothetical protein